MERGIIREPTESTVLLDQFTGTLPAKPKQQIKKTVSIDTQTDVKDVRLESVELDPFNAFQPGGRRDTGAS